MEVPPDKKEENKKGTDEEHTDMDEGEVISELNAATDTTATEAVHECGATKLVGRADDNRGDRRVIETEKGRDSDVAGNKPRHTKEAMHRKEGVNLKLTNNKRPRCTDRKENNQRIANLQQRGAGAEQRRHREKYHAKRERDCEQTD